MISQFDKQGITGFLHEPTASTRRGMVLTHGAGANCQAPLLLRVAEAFCAAGWHVLRYDLAFRQAKRFGPPHPSWAARDREGLRQAAGAIGDWVNGPVVMAGHSYGGRQASMLLAEAPELARALICLSYPLHPPKQPEKLRTAHFPQLRTPALFVHGTADPFATVSELRDAAQAITSPHLISTVDGAGHDLNRGEFDISEQIIGPLHGILDL